MSLTIRDLYGRWFDTSIVARPIDQIVLSTLDLGEAVDGKPWWTTNEDGANGLAALSDCGEVLQLEGCERFPALTVKADETGVWTLTAGSAVLRRVDVYFDVTILLKDCQYTTAGYQVLGDDQDRMVAKVGECLLVRYVLDGDAFREGDDWIVWKTPQPACVEALRMGDQEVWILDYDSGNAGDYSFVFQARDNPCDLQMINKPPDGYS